MTAIARFTFTADQSVDAVILPDDRGILHKCPVMTVSVGADDTLTVEYEPELLRWLPPQESQEGD